MATLRAGPRHAPIFVQNFERTSLQYTRGIGSMVRQVQLIQSYDVDFKPGKMIRPRSLSTGFARMRARLARDAALPSSSGTRRRGRQPAGRYPCI